MKFYAVAATVGAATLASAQLVSDPNGGFTCPEGATAFCAGTSLETNIIIRCSGTTGQPGNCNDNLAGIEPVGVKPFAPCYQSSETAGDAACSWNGIAYPDGGEPFPIPGGNSTSTTTTEIESSSTEAPTETPTEEPSTVVTLTTPVGTGGVYPTGNSTTAHPTVYIPPTLTPTPSIFPGAASQILAPASLVMVPVAGLLALLF